MHRADGLTDPTSSLDPRPGLTVLVRGPSVEWTLGGRSHPHPDASYLIASRDVLGGRCGMLARSRERFEFLG